MLAERARGLLSGEVSRPDEHETRHAISTGVGAGKGQMPSVEQQTDAAAGYPVMRHPRSLGKYSLSETDVLRSANDENEATRDGAAAEAERPLFLGKGDLRRRSSRDGLAPKAVTRPCQRERLNSTQVGASQPIEGSRKRTPEASAAC